MKTKEKLEILRQINRQDILDAMLVLDDKDNYDVGNQYFNVVLNPENENTYPLRELLSTALDTKSVTYEGDILFENPAVGSPMYLRFDELGFEYMSKNELFFRGFEKRDIDDFKGTIQNFENQDLQFFFLLIDRLIKDNDIPFNDVGVAFICQKKSRLIFFVGNPYAVDLSVRDFKYGFQSFKSHPEVSKMEGLEESAYFRVNELTETYQSAIFESVKRNRIKYKNAMYSDSDNPIFRKVCFDENLREEVLEYHKLFFSKRLTKAGIRDFLNQITKEGIALAMGEIENNSFPRTRRIKYYKAVHKVTKKAFAPPLLIEKAYEHSVHKELPAGFFKGIGKGSEFFEFLEENGFDVLKTEINMTYQEILETISYEDIVDTINEIGEELAMDNSEIHSIYFSGNFYKSYALLKRVNNDLPNASNFSSFNSINATKYLNNIGFSSKPNDVYLLKEIKDQDMRGELYIRKSLIGQGKFFLDPREEDPNPVENNPHSIYISMLWDSVDDDFKDYELKNFRDDVHSNNDTRIAGSPRLTLGDIIVFKKNENASYNVKVINASAEEYDGYRSLMEGKSYKLLNEIKLGSKYFKMNSIKTNNQPLNQILYGPPGTGKTFSTITKALDIIGVEYHDYNEAQELFQEELGNRIEFVTMHQSFSYEDFVQGLKPIKGRDGVEFDYKNGVFKEICRRADDTRSGDSIPQQVSLTNREILKIAFYLSKFNGKKKGEKKSNEFLGYESDNDAFIGISVLSGHKPNSIKNHRDKFDFMFKDHLGYTARSGWTPRNNNGVLDNTSKWPYQDIYSELDPLAFDVISELVKNLLKKSSIVEDETIGDHNFVIILDEINRANISRVFGELIALIEEDKRDGRLTATLPSGESFTVPSNLFIIGTMNTADKSIALVDIALRRRFKFEAMYPDTKVLKRVLESKGIAQSEIERRINVLSILNQIIRAKKTVDYEIGHSYFMSDDKLEDIMNAQVLPLMNEYFMYDLRVVKALLEKKQKDRDKKDIPMLGVVFDPEEFKNRGLLKIKSIDPSNVILEDNDSVESETDEEA